MYFFYSIGIRLYVLAISIASLWNNKAKQWKSGRKNWRKNYAALIQRDNKQKTIWFHCASLGEFEMVRPLIENFKKEKPDCFILLSFFSPSGYEIQKNYVHAHAVIYLPADTYSNANDFVDLFQPTLAVFAKYEIWLHYFNALKQSNATILLMNAVFNPEQRFFKWYGGIFRKALMQCDKIFVQSNSSVQLLTTIGIDSEVSGDTRYDRVLQIAQTVNEDKELENWIGNRFCVVCGSTWPIEEKIIAELPIELFNSICWIIAPHDVSVQHINEIKNRFGQSAELLSNKKFDSEKNVLIVDSIGKLSQLYRYSKVSIVGGGFTGKLHNILEPSVYGSTLLFGPRYEKFEEAVMMIREEVAFSFSGAKDLEQILIELSGNKTVLSLNKVRLHKIFEDNRGAVGKVQAYMETVL